jgi:hypothetical protein
MKDRTGTGEARHLDIEAKRGKPECDQGCNGRTSSAPWIWASDAGEGEQGAGATMGLTQGRAQVGRTASRASSMVGPSRRKARAGKSDRRAETGSRARRSGFGKAQGARRKLGRGS